MRLSIIIPTFQCGSFFAETLDFLMKELPGDCELVLVDDGSSDDTPEILRQYDKRYDNIRISLCAHKGASGARNTGLTLAKGDYVAFMDCDDCLHPEFLSQALPLLCRQADLYIFGIKRILCDGQASLWTVKDRTFETVSEFADEYIRSRNLLIYSNCNKFYRNSIIREHGLSFDETLSFGEDRLFNYAYLTYCGRIITSSLLMLDYIQRSTESMSGRHIPQYFEKVRKLHDAKVRCFLSLSKGTDEQERISFVAADLILEVNGTLGRFESHPEEIEENLPEINRMIFEDIQDDPGEVDLFLIPGSRTCLYRAEYALEKGKSNPDTFYVVSGGNCYLETEITEAKVMADYLIKNGVPESRVYLENEATYTRANLELSAPIIDRIRKEHPKVKRIGIVTAWFHMRRTRLLREHDNLFSDMEVSYFPCRLDQTSPEIWYQNDNVKKALLAEIEKTTILTGKEP